MMEAVNAIRFSYSAPRPILAAKGGCLMWIRITLPFAALGTRRAPAPRFSLGRMLRAMRTRDELAALDERMLKDIGLSRAEALAEARRAPWDLTPPPQRL
jgi:uncharacterized protein YjiS (DUF1127 family)